jgi:hypothetical protein
MIDTLQAAANGAQAGSEQTHTRQFLDHMDERLVGDFDALAEQQRKISADLFNDDDNYKLYLNEVSKVANSVFVLTAEVNSLGAAMCNRHWIAKTSSS